MSIKSPEQEAISELAAQMRQLEATLGKKLDHLLRAVNAISMDELANHQERVDIVSRVAKLERWKEDVEARAARIRRENLFS